MSSQPACTSDASSGGWKYTKDIISLLISLLDFQPCGILIKPQWIGKSLRGWNGRFWISIQGFTISMVWVQIFAALHCTKDVLIELLRCLRENPGFRFMQMVCADKQQLLKPLCYSLKLVFTHIEMFLKSVFWTVLNPNPPLTKSILYSSNQVPLP